MSDSPIPMDWESVPDQALYFMNSVGMYTPYGSSSATVDTKPYFPTITSVNRIRYTPLRIKEK
jgi:hypothetical protein